MSTSSSFSLVTFLSQLYSLYKPLFGLKKNKKWRTLAGVLMLTISALLALTMNLINDSMVDFVDILGQSTITYSAYFTGLSYFLSTIVLYSALTFVNTWIASWLGESLSFAISKKLTKRWMDTEAYHGSKFLPQQQEELNFAQTISRDTAKLNAEVLDLGNSFLNTLGNFVVGSLGLYAMSIPLNLTLFSLSFTIPGYLLASTLIYAISYNYISKKASHSLRKNFDANTQLESNFFHQIEHVATRAEPIAFWRGKDYERKKLLEILSNNRLVQKSLINTRSALNFLISFHYNFSNLVTFILASPSVIAGKLQMSNLFSLSNHFNFVVSFFTWESVNFDTLTECDVRLQKLQSVHQQLSAWEQMKQNQKLTHSHQGNNIHVELTIKAPNGELLLQNFNRTITKGKRTQITGPSGKGKTSLLRALRNISVNAQGKITGLPPDTTFICSEPYFPRNAALLEAFFYPRMQAITRSERAEVIRLMREMNFSEDKIQELDQVKDWNGTALSDGEKKRIMIINAILKIPSTLVMDEATRGIDEQTKVKVQKILAQRLSKATIIFTDHNPTTPAFSQRKINL